MGENPGINPSGTLYIGNNSLLSIGNDNKLLIDNGKVCINGVEIIPLSSVFDKNLYEYFANGSGVLTSVTLNNVVTVSSDMFTLVEGGTYEFTFNNADNLELSLVTVNVDEIFDNEIGNFTSTINYSLPQSITKKTNHRFFIYAKANSLVRFKIQNASPNVVIRLVIRIKRVGTLNTVETTQHNIPLLLKSATSAIVQTIANATYDILINYIGTSLFQLYFLSNVGVTNNYNYNFITKVASNVVKNKKILDDATLVIKWDMIKANILQKVSPEIGESINIIESKCQSWTISLLDVYNTIPIRAINESQQKLGLKKLVMLQHAFAFTYLNKLESGLITSVTIEDPENVNHNPSIIDVTTSLSEQALPNLNIAVNPLNSNIAQYNSEMTKIYLNSAKLLLTSNDAPTLIKILQDTCHINGCLERSIGTFIKSFNTQYTKMTEDSNNQVVPELIMQKPVKLIAGDTQHPLLEVAELVLSSPNNEIKLTGVRRTIGSFPFINRTTKITNDQLYGTYYSDHLIPYQCSDTMTITAPVISISISNGLTRYVIKNATPANITGSIPYWKAPATLLPNIPIKRAGRNRLCYIKILNAQGTYSVYYLDVSTYTPTIDENLGTVPIPTLILQQLSIEQATSSIFQPYLEVHRKFLSIVGLTSTLYGAIENFDYLDAMGLLTSTLVKILTTVLCVSSESPDISLNMILLDESIYDDIPALYGIIKNGALQSTIWQSFIDFTQPLQTINYYAKLIIKVRNLSNDIQFNYIFTEKLLTVEPFTDTTLIDSYNSELLNDIPKLIGILLSNTTLDYILSKWNAYYALFLTTNDNSTETDFYIQLLVNSLRDCYTNWGNNLLNTIQNPLDRFLEVPYANVSISKLPYGLSSYKLYVENREFTIKTRYDLRYCDQLLTNINAIPNLNPAVKTAVLTAGQHVTTRRNYIEATMSDLERRSGIFRSTERVLFSLLLQLNTIINMSPFINDIKSTDLLSDKIYKSSFITAGENVLNNALNPFKDFLLKFSKILDISGVMNRIDSSFYTLGQLTDNNLLRTITPTPTIINRCQAIEPVLENLIKTLQKVVDIRGVSLLI